MSGNDIPYAGPRFNDASLVTINEVRGNEVQVPSGSVPYTVQAGDNLWNIARQNGYGDPPDMNAFYANNGQYADRNPNEIYPGEVVFVHPPQNGTVQTGQQDANGRVEYQNYQNGQPSGEPYHADTAPNGLPANSETVNEQGVVIRTDGSGNPLTGTYRGTDEAGLVGSDMSYRSYTQQYENGRPVGPKHYAPGRML